MLIFIMSFIPLIEPPARSPLAHVAICRYFLLPTL